MMDIDKLLSERRWVYVIVIEQYEEGKGYIPSIAIEGVPGHFPLKGRGPGAEPWYWGMTYKDACDIADVENSKRGYTVLESLKIVASTMR